MEFTELSNVPFENNYCLLCFEKLKSFCQPTSLNSAEVFQDVFQVFSKYMGWDPPPEYKYDFYKHQFPFCGGCNLILIRIYKINEEMQALEKQIEQFMLSATGKILDSECKIAASTRKKNRRSLRPDLKGITMPCEIVRLDERKICVYYRESILKRFSVRVQLTGEDTKQLENYERALKLEEQHVPGDFDQGDDVYDGFVSSPERSVDSEDDPTEAQDTKTNTIKNQKIKTAKDSTSASDNSDECSSESPDKQSEAQVPGFRKPSFNSRIKELSPNEYLLDDKLSFVYQNPGWKCSACSKTALQRSTLVSHITSAYCPGLVSPNSVKELQHRGFKYDKLVDGRFECRRCPLVTTSKTSLKRHIDMLHYRGLGSRKRRLLVRELVKSASLSQLRPGVFLANNETEVKFGFGNNKFSCSACSYRTRVKTAIIRHVIQKHGNHVNALRIHSLGPNKYKLGDFPFEAFPNEFKCTTCGHTCVSLLHMKQHIRYEHVKDMSKNICDICGHSTFDNRAFKDHMSSHKVERPFLCPTCGKSFKIKQMLTMHQAAVHPTAPIVKSHLCEICGQKFVKKSRLNYHMKIHQNVDCEICGKTYSPIYLPKHLESHNAEKMFECKICGSKFQHQESLRTHGKSCNGDKPYSCDLCDMKFTQAYSVTRHKNVAHNPEKTTRTRVRKGPAKQRRGQSLLAKKSSAASEGRDAESNKAANATPKVISSNITQLL